MSFMRIRIPNKVDNAADYQRVPIQNLYLTHKDLRPQYFRMYGPCFSTALTFKLAALYERRGVKNCSKMHGAYNIVVPIEQKPGTSYLVPFTRAVTVSAYGELLDGTTAELHLGTGPGDIRPFCTGCPRALERLMGHCTPGEPECFSSLEVRIDRRVET